jgi:hypothetical protein
MRRSAWILRCLSLALLLALLGAAPPSMACQCIAFGVQGFIHPDITVLPANAKGVLFLAPASLTPAPEMFTVAMASGAPAGKATIEPVVLPPAHPLSVRLPDGARLVRIGVEGGFTAGTHYTIGFVQGDAFSVRHAGVSFDIDPTPFDLVAQRFAVQLDGPARRTMLDVADGGGMCAAAEAALVQDFHIAIPDALQRYLPALSLLAEEQDARPGAAYAPVQYRPSLCTPPLVDQGALPAGRELIHRDCGSPVDRVHLRAWVGMLEVDERVVAAKTAVADFGPARSLGCSPYGMLRDAIERDDAGDTTHLACELGRPGDLRLASIDLDKEPVPAPAQWLKLVRLADAQTAACGMAAMQRMLVMSKPGHPALRSAYLTLAQERLRGHDRAAVDATLMQLAELQDTMTHERGPGRAPAWPKDAILPLLPELLQAVDAGGPATVRALQLIGAFGPQARSAAPRLREVAEQDRPEAIFAVQALASIIPADPALQQSLLDWARRPALGSAPALAFARVAGQSRPREAVALLLPRAQANDTSAIDALAEIGPAAASATAVLFDRMERSPERYVQARALRAAIKVAPDEAAVVGTLARSLLGPPNPNLSPSDYAGLARFKAHAVDFVPVLEHLIDGMRWPFQKVALRTLVSAMALSEAQKQALLERLDRPAL